MMVAGMFVCMCTRVSVYVCMYVSNEHKKWCEEYCIGISVRVVNNCYCVVVVVFVVFVIVVMVVN